MADRVLSFHAVNVGFLRGARASVGPTREPQKTQLFIGIKPSG
jgi:hypothetical protein